MGTWTGTACLSSPASQSFPPFIAPLVLRSTPQRCTYQTWTSVMFRLPKPWWRGRCWEGRIAAWKWGSRGGSLAELTGRWEGRVRRAHSWPYPLSCILATALNGVTTSITVSCHSEPSDWLEGRGRGSGLPSSSKVKSSILKFSTLVHFPGKTPSETFSGFWFPITVG